LASGLAAAVFSFPFLLLRANEMARCPAYRNFALPLSPSCRYATFLATLSTSDSSFKNWILGILGTVIAAVLIFVIEQRLTRPPPPPPGGLGVTPGGVVIHPAVAQYVKRQDFARLIVPQHH